MLSARNGRSRIQDEEVIEVIAAAEVRAKLTRAARMYEARVLAGFDDEETTEAEAGAILEAETAVEIHELRNWVKEYVGAK